MRLTESTGFRVTRLGDQNGFRWAWAVWRQEAGINLLPVGVPLNTPPLWLQRLWRWPLKCSLHPSLPRSGWKVREASIRLAEGGPVPVLLEHGILEIGSVSFALRWEKQQQVLLPARPLRKQPLRRKMSLAGKTHGGWCLRVTLLGRLSRSNAHRVA